MKNLLWLDDQRNPFLNDENKVPKNIHDWNINWVRNFREFVAWIEAYGLPDAISFDHDLHDEHYTPEFFWNDYELSKKYQEWRSRSYVYETGADCAKWLLKYCRINKEQLPEIFIHSANPVGADNIKELLCNNKRNDFHN
jgi:hypothetical protein